MSRRRKAKTWAGGKRDQQEVTRRRLAAGWREDAIEREATELGDRAMKLTEQREARRTR